MSGIIYTPPTAAAVIPDLDQVMNTGNITTVAYIGTGISLGTRTVTGPATYNVTDTDFLLLCDISAGNVNINIDSVYQQIYSVKLVNWQQGNIARITITGGGTIDGIPTYVLTRAHGSVIIASKGNAGDFAVIGSNDALGSVNSGKYTAAAFAGATLTIPHTLNVIPTGVTITPGDFDGLSLLSNSYFVTVNATNITIDFTALVAMPNPFVIFWSVTRN
jgi:hypothetical protein